MYVYSKKDEIYYSDFLLDIGKKLFLINFILNYIRRITNIDWSRKYILVFPHYKKHHEIECKTRGKKI